MFQNTKAFKKQEDAGINLQFRLTAKGKFLNGSYPQMPTHWVENDLFRAMRTALHKPAYSGMMYVYCAHQLNGKSVASGAAIWSAIQMFENYPYLYVEAGHSLRETMRYQLDVPDSIRDDKVWLKDLFDAVKRSEKDETKEKKQRSPWGQFLDAVSKKARHGADCFASGICSDNTVEDTEDTISKAEYVNVVGNIPPIIVLDNVRALDRKSSDLLTTVYSEAHEKRVIVFVLTDDEVLANYICGLNGKKRVVPLPSRFRVEHGQSDWVIEKEGLEIAGGFYDPRKAARNIVWTPEPWPKDVLTRSVQKAFPEETFEGYFDGDGCLTFVIVGECPTRSIDKWVEISSSLS